MYNKNVWIKLKTNHIFCSLHLFSVWPSQWYCARVNTFNGFGWKYTELNILSENKSTQNIQQTCGVSPYMCGRLHCVHKWFEIPQTEGSWNANN